MLDDMRVNDIELTVADIGALENADQVANLFVKLGYNVDTRTTIPDIATLGLDNDDLRQQILRLELLAVDPVDKDIKIYLFEVRSVTAKLRNDIARRFRERPENALLVLTADYETLDFVMLQRENIRTKSRGKSLTQVIRPIPLNINRRNPESLKLRVLKRFSFTEEDSAYQWEKLRSAYMLAEWSEEYFNNRALFSDYYLKQRLTDVKLTTEWSENVRPAGLEAYNHIISARQKFSSQPVATIRKELYEPLLTLLGFDFTINKASDSAADEPDYLLYSKGERSKPIAVALTYVWNRNLDDVDVSRELEEDKGGTPFEIPGAMVVSLLEKQVAPWVIVTNGKLWRLYSSTASNKATNYYEIDLEEAIAATDQITALKYWWLMFRQQAFTGFLDMLLIESAKYAKELGERLKDDVFLRIFPQFAKGFITNMRARGVKEADIDLDVVFSGTMTFLYRMMFILYAESLDLLPVSEERGYGEYSLYALKRELARVAGENETDAPDKLRKHYTTQSTTIYERLKLLFGVIDKGSADLNMPTYNGGLFNAENESGLFLERYAIPDQFLMLGLDRLTRDEESKTNKLVLIDFKSLGVRQLGSIYEGLLEFKLKIATEPLTVEKNGKRESYIPLNKAKKKDAAIAVAKGEVYLENDKQERKATGSYYTPDYIVKYIVQHTVGPVLERKLSDCEPRLRQAQKKYRDYAKLAEARRKSTGKDDSPLTFWNSDAMAQLVDDCLNVRVLDPAMGSGHFLVEVVDFVSNKLITFLNGWSDNPVWAALDRIREDILADMERQQVTIDSDKLTRVALLKRAVLKRCVYGVDLNLMAVELAKVSLWLDAFTLGAPLSFLDHHLKWGNSLIGARVKEVQDYLKGDGSGQLDMFSTNEFAGVMLATDLMRQVSYLSDNTIAQAQQSRDAYRNATDHLAPFKRLLDVYTSRWFDNQKIETGAKGVKKSKTDYVRVFLREKDVQTWLKHPNTTRLSDALVPATTIATNALKAAKEKRFFHWELEFPEVFFASSTPGGQDVKLREEGGFDAVVGNPPYVDSENMVKNMPEEREYIAQVYATASGNWDLYIPFIEMACSQIHNRGYSAFIIPNKWVSIDYGVALRSAIFDRIVLIADYSRGRVFDEAGVFPVVVCIHGSATSDPLKVEVFTTDHKLSLRQQIDRKHLRDDAIWGLVFSERFGIFIKLWNTTDKLAKYVDTESAFTVSEAYEVGEFLVDGDPESKDFRFIVTGSIDRYESLWGAKNTRYLKENYDFPVIDRSRFEQYSKRRFAQATSEKIIIAGIRYFEAVLDAMGEYIAAKSTSIVRNFKNGIKSEMVLALLNAHLTSFYLKELYGSLAMDGGITFTHNMVAILPMPRISFSTPASQREQLANAITTEYANGSYDLVLQWSMSALTQGQTDVVHDVLAHLAQQMIDLNKRKQAEVKRFLGWLESKLGIRPKADGSTGIDSLTGKTILQGYLGDYQKGRPAVSWTDFKYRLHQNRNRFGVALSSIEAEVEREYAASLTTLLPIKDQLAKTDTLIDKIVYQLYGLTAAEIELIERPQYEQALTDAKADALKDETLTDEEAIIDKITEGILPAAQRFFERIDPHDVEVTLDGELPKWRTLPPDAPTFLLTGDYNLRSLPDHMDFSSSALPYSKAVEVALHRLIFEPFRASHQDSDCRNEFLQKFMRGEKELTLTNYMIILSSTSEKALRGFVGRRVSDVDGFAKTLNDAEIREIRNKGAHDEVVSRDEASQARVWAFMILGQV